MTILRYVPHHRVLDYARLGWDIADTLEGCSHGQYALLMVWLCCCPCIEPTHTAGKMTKDQRNMTTVNGGMSKGERVELAQIIRKRERVMKASASERSAVLLSEFDAQLASIYTYDDDDIWKAAYEAAEQTAKDAQKTILARCKDLGIPEEFAPGVAFGWYGRGQNGVAGRRAELRRAAKAKIELIEARARTDIERLSLEAQTEVVAHGLQSQAAKAFLETLPTKLEVMMPSVSTEEIKMIVDQKHARTSHAHGGGSWKEP